MPTRAHPAQPQHDQGEVRNREDVVPAVAQVAAESLAATYERIQREHSQWFDLSLHDRVQRQDRPESFARQDERLVSDAFEHGVQILGFT